MKNFLEQLFTNVNKDSKVFVFIPPDLFSLSLVSDKYSLLFLLMKEKIDIYPRIIYYKKSEVGRLMHQMFFDHGSCIQWSKISVLNEIKRHNYDAGFFCWKYDYIADYFKTVFGISIPEVKPGGCYFLHLPEGGEPELTVITKNDLMKSLS